MRIRVSCNECGKAFQVDAKYAGRKGKCPNPDCRAVCHVPEPAVDDEDDRDDDLADELPPLRSAPRAVRNQLERARALPARNRSSRSSSKKTGGRSNRSGGSKWMIAAGTGLAAATVAGLLLLFPGPPKEPHGPLSGVSDVVAAEPQPVDRFPRDAEPFLKKFCVDCHAGDMPEAGVAFDQTFSDLLVRKDRRHWQRVKELVELGVMPPMDSPQPSSDEKGTFLTYVDHVLNHVDCSGASDPGRVTIRRLNRSEYNNTVRDLLGVTFRPADDFPSDDVGYGFDNIGDVLSLPPLLMEKYIAAAETIARQAIVAIDPAHPPVVALPAARLKHGPATHEGGDDRLVIVSTGHATAEVEPAIGGKFTIRVRASGQQAGNEPAKMEIRVDGRALKTFDVKNKERKLEWFELPVELSHGPHAIDVAFVNDFYDAEKKQDRNLFVSEVQLIGPIEIKPEDLPASHRELLAQRPSADRTVNVAVRNNLMPFVTKAFRRPVRDDELDGIVKLVEQLLQDGEIFESAMQTAVTAVLVSPHFLFRVETDRNPNDPNDKHPLNDFELATRLSYFLWSSMPDTELMQLASQGTLHDDAVLDAQVLRMLKDPKSQSLVDNFVEQWLQLRVLSEITPDPEKFPDFTPELKADLMAETRKFVEHVIREDLSLMELLMGQYTFVNERLAKHYGLNGVTGNEWQKVSLEGTQRTGILTHGSVLTMTSNPNRTSPVKRGKWILEVVLDEPPPPAPPNVPDLTAVKAAPDATLRQQMELHRTNPTCASCHRVMDDLGFGLENFDAVGRWRDAEGGQPLDTKGELPGGKTFAGPRQLSQVLLDRQDQFARATAEKLLTFALGRGLEYYDRCTSNKILEQSRAAGFRFSSIVSAVVKSEPFRMRRGEAVTTVTP
jgi:mono/diheme cytochrome c family protein